MPGGSGQSGSGNSRTNRRASAIAIGALGSRNQNRRPQRLTAFNGLVRLDGVL